MGQFLQFAGRVAGPLDVATAEQDLHRGGEDSMAVGRNLCLGQETEHNGLGRLRPTAGEPKQGQPGLRLKPVSAGAVIGALRLVVPTEQP